MYTEMCYAPLKYFFLHIDFLVSEYETNKRMTVFDLISSIGGLLGVCAGISILSCAEIFYWMLLKMITNWHR